MTAPVPAVIDRRELGRRFIHLAALLALPRTATTLAGGPLAVAVDADVMVPMRDGVKLATDVYRPAGEDPDRWPVILERTPYGKSQAGTRHASVEVARWFASRGYVVVFQDCRGRGKSEGQYVKYLSDGRDGFDCCAWLLAQPFANGRIGTMGLSYAAHTQGALASAGAPGVKALFMDSGGFSDAYQGGIRQGGAFELKQVTWAFNEALEAPEIRNDPARFAAMKAVDLKEWFAQMPWTRGHSPLSAAPDYEEYVFDQWEHGDFDAYWRQLGIYAKGYYGAYCDAATLLISSWYDPYPRTITDNFVALSRLKRGPIHMVLGPWTHGNREQTFAGDVEFGPSAAFERNVAPSYLDAKLRWFDRFLKDEPNGAENDPAVRIFVMGGGSGRRDPEGRMQHGGRWRAEQTWPIARTRLRSLYLHADGRLSGARPPREAMARAFLYDPAHPVPTIGGTVTSGLPIMVGGAFDQREDTRFFGSRMPYGRLADRADVLVFRSDPLPEDLEVTGNIEAYLWIASDAPDTDFTIKLIDEYPPNQDYPDGFAMNLTDGILRCRYRNSWEHPQLMAPGEVYPITVSAFPTSNLFKQHHRIRLDISSSNFPHFDRNPNTGEPEGKGTAFRVANNRVFVDARHASRLLLPVIS